MFLQQLHSQPALLLSDAAILQSLCSCSAQKERGKGRRRTQPGLRLAQRGEDGQQEGVQVAHVCKAGLHDDLLHQAPVEALQQHPSELAVLVAQACVVWASGCAPVLP